MTGHHVTSRTDVKAAVALLDAMPTDDPERAHGIADDILLAVAPPKVAEAYRGLVERCDWWAGA